MIQHYYRHDLLPGLQGGDPQRGANETPCPVCSEGDRTAKASVIARSGRGSLRLEDGSSAQFESELAYLVREPAQPEWWQASNVVTAFLVSWALLLVNILIVAGLRSQDFVTLPAAALSTATWVGVLWFGLLVPGLALARYLITYRDATQRMPGWRSATRKWRQLHYCYRDDVVFLPGEPRAVSPEHTALLLNVTDEPEHVSAPVNGHRPHTNGHARPENGHAKPEEEQEIVDEATRPRRRKGRAA